MEDLLLLHHLTESFIGLLLTIGICSTRILTVLMVLPALSDQVLQGTARNSVAIMFGTFVAYGQPVSLQEMPALMMLLVVGKEAILGLILGFAASTIFWAASSIGVLIDDLAGFNNIQVSNPMRQDISTPISALLEQLTIAAFWVLGGMIFLLGALYQSFHWWPIESLTPVAGSILESFVLHQTDTLMETICKLAAPMVLVLVLVDLAFGFLAKGAEKLDLMAYGQPVKGTITLFMLAIFIGIFLNQVQAQLSLKDIAAQFQNVSKSR